MFDWGDIRFFLAVARTGSSVAAAAEVKTSQSTVTRRIDAIEAALGLKLFERSAQGYRLTDQGQALLPIAEQAEGAMLQIAEAAGSAKRQLSGRIRFATPPTSALLGPVVEFMRLHPGVVVEVIPASIFHDVAGGEVDVAFRAGPRPAEPDLVVRKIGDVVWQACCSRDYLARHGAPASYQDLEGHHVFGAEGQLAGSVPFRRLAELVGPRLHGATSIDGLIGFARAGAGITILPEVTIAELDDLVPCLPPLEEAPSEAWLITRQDVRKTPHVRAFIDYIVAHLSTLLARGPGDSRRFASMHPPPGPSDTGP